MDTYQRPITPPSDQTKDHVRSTVLPTSNAGINSTPGYSEKVGLSDKSHLQRQQEAIHNNRDSLSSLDNNRKSDTYPDTNARLSSDIASHPTSNSRLSGSSDIYGLDDTAYNSSAAAVAPSSTHNATIPKYNTSTPPTNSALNSGSSAHTSASVPTSAYSSANAPSSTYRAASQSSAPSAPTTSSSVSNPFKDSSESTSIPSTRKFDHDGIASPNKKTFNSSFEDEPTTQKKYRGYGRNETTHRMETEVLSVLQWKNPVRSGALFALIVGSIVLTRWYSLLQIGSTCLTLAIGINLVYVNLILQSQKVLTNQQAAHPYSDVISNDHHSLIDRRSVNHYSTVITELSETVIRALTRIIFVEDTLTSVKWMSIFFAIWKISAHFSTMDIVLMVVISAFTFPRLYISNKNVVDAHLQKGQTLLQSGIHKAQTAATENAQNTYVKAKAYVAQVGTTGTDAKNTMTKHSVTMKEDKAL